MVKIGGFDLDNLKKMGSDLMSSVTKGGPSKEALPEEIKTKVEEIGKYTSELAEAHNKVNEIASALQKTIMEFQQNVIALYKPEAPAKTEEPKPEAPKAEEQKPEEKPEEPKEAAPEPEKTEEPKAEETEEKKE